LAPAAARDNRATPVELSRLGGRAMAANRAIVMALDDLPISEFLIVGCHHGWLAATR